MITCAYKNGEAYDASVFTERAFMYADGFFETMRSCGQHVPLWSYHLRRIERSAKKLSLHINVSELTNFIEHALLHASKESESTAQANQEYIVKLIIGRADSHRASYPSVNGRADVYVFIRSLSDRTSLDKSYALKSLSRPLQTLGAFSGLKLLSRVHYTAALAGLTPEKNQEYVLHDDHAHVIETMHHNIFVVKGQHCITPSLDHVGVKGVMRDYILDFLQSHIASTTTQLTLTESPIALAELPSFDEVFLSNAVDGVVPVTVFDQHKYTNVCSSGSVSHLVKQHVDTLWQTV